MKYELLGNIIEVSKGKKHNIVEAPSLNSKRIIGINDLRNDTNIVFTDDSNGVEACGKDILIAWDGANAGTIGFGKEGFIGSTIARLRIKNTMKYSEIFLGKLLQSKFGYLRSTATGATIPHINRAALNSIKVPQFELTDQISIATVLTGAEALIAKRKESLKALDELLKSTFLEMFGDPVRNEKGGTLSPLGEKLSVKHGFAFQGKFFSNTGEYILLTPGNFFEGGGYRDRGDKQKYYQGEIPKEYILNKGELLIAMTEQAPGLLGSPLIVSESNKFLHNQRLGLIVLKKEDLNRLYLFHLFNHPNIRKLIHSKATGTKVRHTSPSKIEEVMVSFPPLLLQNQFAAIVEKVEVLKAKYNQNLVDLENLYGSLSQRAFKGKLDLSKIVEKTKNEMTKLYELEKGITSTNCNHKEASKAKYSEAALLEFIQSKSGKTFSIDSLLTELKKANFDEIPKYEELKEQIYYLLEESKLTQILGEVKDDSGKVVEKKIMLRVNI
ncbi:restriction endonuclease subunit S [Peribacillus frigoritolerans]|uniref:restriction endonuclease subunit S n=1 Tax=Peribacillus frigoritolerans TaxID=450367 RepID=UPI00399FA85D